MPFFYQWETADFPLHLTREGCLEDVIEVIVSIKQNKALIEKKGDELGLDVANNIINFHLTQEDTSKFTPGTALLQVNLYYENTARDVSAQATIQVKDNLHKELMP